MPPKFQNMAELTGYLSDLENRIISLESENSSLQAYIKNIGTDAGNLLPKTGLISPSFIQRAFTVWGHYFVAQLIISIPIICGYFILIYAFLNQAGQY